MGGASVVFYGREPGVYKDRNLRKRQTKEYPGSFSKKYASLAEAQIEWNKFLASKTIDTGTTWVVFEGLKPGIYSSHDDARQQYENIPFSRHANYPRTYAAELAWQEHEHLQKTSLKRKAPVSDGEASPDSTTKSESKLGLDLTSSSCSASIMNQDSGSISNLNLDKKMVTEESIAAHSEPMESSTSHSDTPNKRVKTDNTKDDRVLSAPDSAVSLMSTKAADVGGGYSSIAKRTARIDGVSVEEIAAATGDTANDPANEQAGELSSQHSQVMVVRNIMEAYIKTIQSRFSLYAGPVVRIFVGEKNHKFHVHASLIDLRTRHFKDIFKLNKEDETFSASAISPLTFAMFIHWLYTGGIFEDDDPFSGMLHIALDDLTDWVRILSDLWVLAGDLSAPTLQNRTIKGLNRFFDCCDDSYIYLGEVSYIYARTKKGSFLRQWCIDKFMRAEEDNQLTVDDIRSCEAEALIDILAGFANMRDKLDSDMMMKGNLLVDSYLVPVTVTTTAP